MFFPGSIQGIVWRKSVIGGLAHACCRCWCILSIPLLTAHRRESLFKDGRVKNTMMAGTLVIALASEEKFFSVLARKGA